jgi:hypothetical protein
VIALEYNLVVLVFGLQPDGAWFYCICTIGKPGGARFYCF